MTDLHVSPNERLRRHRERRRSGLAVFSFEGDETEVPEILIEAGFLDPFDIENRDAISRALTRWSLHSDDHSVKQ